MLIRWEPGAAISAGVGPVEAARFLDATDFDFFDYNHGPDSGLSWSEAEAALERTHPHWLEHARAYREHFPLSVARPLPGSVEIVRELSAAGVPQWGLTNWSAELYPVAPRTHDFLALLDDVVVSGREGAAKPDRAIFEILADRTGQPWDRLVFVDDSARNVDAAAALGIDAILFTDPASARAALRERGLPLG